MILADTSVWVDHLRRTDTALSTRLQQHLVLCHPFVIGELSVGSLKQRKVILSALQALPKAQIATDAEVLHLISTRFLFGTGLGYIDAHLLASVLLTPGASLWTRDSRLLNAARKLSIAFEL